MRCCITKTTKGGSRPAYRNRHSYRAAAKTFCALLISRPKTGLLEASNLFSSRLMSLEETCGFVRLYRRAGCRLQFSVSMAHLG